MQEIGFHFQKTLLYFQAEQAREEQLEDETRVEEDEGREDAAGDEQNVDNHRDEEPFDG